MAEQIEELAHFVAQTQWEDIPGEIQRHAKLVLLDTFGVILAGATQPEVRGLHAGLSSSAGTGATVFTRGWPVTDAGRAALLNGIAGRSIELCESHIDVSSQGAVQIVPGVLATAESARGSGREMMTALVVGYDVAVRIAAALTRRPLAHPNGQAALLGAVAAGARMRGLDAARTSLAMRIGVTLMVTASYTNAVNGATALNVAGGMSGFASTLAPELALAGFTAQEDAIEQSLGSLVGDGFDPGGLVDGLGTRWEIAHNHFRLRACCNPIYPALDALEDALAQLRPQPDDIERIDVATYRFAAVMRNPDPPNAFGSHYSLPHAAAALIVKGSLGHSSFQEGARLDPAIAALRHRVHISEDPAMTAALPRNKPARVTLMLKDGRKSTHEYLQPRRDYERPYEESDLRAKFRELAGLVIPPEGVERIEAAIDRCEEWTSVDPLVDLLRSHGGHGRDAGVA